MITVVNKYHTNFGEYIGRGSPLGNPFSWVSGTTARYTVKDREEAIAKYRPWLIEQIQTGNQLVINELKRLLDLAQKTGELKLRCFCATKSCHGDVIKEYLEYQLREGGNYQLRPWK